MNAFKNSIFHTQNHLSQNHLSQNNPLFFNFSEPTVTLKQSSNQAVKSLLQLNPLYSHSESSSQYSTFRDTIVLINKLSSIIVSFYPSEDDELLSDRERVFYKKPILELKEKIYNVYYECQTENWDGYEAEPIRYLSQSLQFADVLFSESRMLIESVDIIPENDGCPLF